MRLRSKTKTISGLFIVLNAKSGLQSMGDLDWLHILPIWYILALHSVTFVHIIPKMYGLTF